MVEKSVTVSLSTGLQARPAAQFVQEANRFGSEIFLEKEGKRVNAKSIMGLMSVAVGPGEDVIIQAKGSDEENALEVLVNFVTKE